MAERTNELPRPEEGTLRHLSVYLVLLFPITLFAFWKSYFAILGSSAGEITGLVHIHAASNVLWLLILVAQAMLIRSNNLRLHRVIGLSSLVIVPLIIFTGFLTTHAFFNKPVPPGMTFEELRYQDIITLGQLLAFGLVWGLAIVYRNQRWLHVRFIISTVFAIGSAIVFRVFFFWVPGFDSPTMAITGNGAVLVLILLVLIGLDWRNGIKRSPFWVVMLALIVLHVGYLTFARSNWWVGFCRWYADLPLT